MAERVQNNGDIHFINQKNTGVGSLLKDVTIFAIKTGVLLYGASKLSTAITVPAFINKLRGVNKSRGDSLGSATKSHKEDEMQLLQYLAPLSDREAEALARKVGSGDLSNVLDNKQHRRILSEVRRTAATIVYQRKPEKKGKRK